MLGWLEYLQLAQFLSICDYARDDVFSYAFLHHHCFYLNLSYDAYDVCGDDDDVYDLNDDDENAFHRRYCHSTIYGDCDVNFYDACESFHYDHGWCPYDDNSPHPRAPPRNYAF